MKAVLACLWAMFLCRSEALHAQNTDLLVQSASGKSLGLAGAGMALVSEASAIELNPAGLAQSHGVMIALSSRASSYSYSLLRRNSNGTAFDLNWSASRAYVDHAGLAWALGSRVGIGAGYARKLNPFIDNDRRAITGSVLFHQTTRGGVYALSLAAGLKLNEHVGAGVSLSRYSGRVASRIRGDNHGRETHKWAELEHELMGFGFQLGMKYSAEKISLAARFSSPAKLQTTVRARVSEDRDYAIYFPPYAKLDFHLPLIAGIGLAYTGFKRWTFVADFELQRFEPSLLQLNLYEAGGKPNWKDANLLRVGAEFFPFARFNLPLRLGYAYLPQLYSSNIALGAQNPSTSDIDTSRNRKHLLTAGTTLNGKKFSLHLGFEYSFLAWHRRLETGRTVLDDYREIQFALSGELEYRWR